MTVTEQQRHRLLAWFEEHMGRDLGATMMELIPATGASPPATKADVDHAVSAVRSDLDHAFTALRAEMNEGLLSLRAEVKQDLLGVQRTFGTWLFASQAAVIAVVGVVTAVT